MDNSETCDRGIAALIELAMRSGATGAVAISTGDIIVEDRLAGICKETNCEGYGQSMSCPPHVAGPSKFRNWLKEMDRAIVVKIDVPLEILFSERDDVMRLLHEIVASVELEAKRLGFAKSRAFAGGSCRQFFCLPHGYCRVVAGEGECRNPDRARPSMSGFGINVPEMMRAAGWIEDQKKTKSQKEASMGTASGLILIG